MKRGILTAFALTYLVVLATCFLALWACSGNAQKDIKTAHDGVVLANDSCVLIRDVVPDGSPASQVCATEQELAPFINAILSGRKHKASDAGADAGSASLPDASK